MTIKDITEKKNSVVPSIVHLKKNNIFPIKINKTIEIVTVPKLADIKANQKNVGIVLDEKLILNILSIFDIVWLSKSEQEYPRSLSFNFLQDFFA